MPKVSTDKNLIEKFLTRGVEKIYPSADALRQKLISGERLKVYQGFDPTGPYLHVGHAIGIRALRILQELGHEVIFLVGDYTAKVGDPDKDTTRAILSDEIIKKNMAGWKKQAAQLINFEGKNAVKFERNHTWLSKLKLSDLIKLMSHMTVPQMLARDLFKKRMAEGKDIYLQEFIYPLMQGYDSVAMKVDMEIGGADQTFNMLVGRDLVKSYLGKEKFVRANKMMDAPDGRTMRKTKGNGINLGDSAEEMYGKAMSYPDTAILNGLELLTDIPMNIIKEIGNSMKQGENPMRYKKTMAFEIIKAIKGKEAAQKAQEHFEKTVQNKEVPDEVVETHCNASLQNIIELLVENNLASSKNEARRLIEQKGIKVDGKAITDVNAKIKATKEGILIQRGKRQFVRLKKV
ncbi:tyrosine--tRNA ligase [Candidatus Falkowbacteria bacterium CG10_big_fil_rev_8_21_14_0_10_43_10]|uniref:Tyrosine--tRNA ligase n=1 Tax=Candidatus Falkowbacteria bacterium CG10_big_fil_rev_8_21_14_0_10_43_10 TaxID=1974567 RepID=A0A2H0V1R7_9BACT|nr:MAG: tyrosine--tRNA ligase [Candidatus Falkowbacteria bacterium CG10_big_fil_rev_8_21_14_0_10_43_10]